MGLHPLLSLAPPALVDGAPAALSGGEGQKEVGVRVKGWGSLGKRRSLLRSEQDEGDLLT